MFFQLPHNSILVSKQLIVVDGKNSGARFNKPLQTCQNRPIAIILPKMKINMSGRISVVNFFSQGFQHGYKKLIELKTCTSSKNSFGFS